LAWQELGDVGHAESLCATAEGLLLEDTPHCGPMRALVRAHAQAGAGRLDVSTAAFADADDLKAEHEVARCQNPSLANKRLFYQPLADFYTRQGDWPNADLAFRSAVQASQGLLEKFIEPADQTRFRQCQQPLLERFAQCLRQLGKV